MLMMALTSAMIFGQSMKPAHADMPSHLKNHRTYHSRTLGNKRNQINNLREANTVRYMTEKERHDEVALVLEMVKQKYPDQYPESIQPE